MDKQNIISDMRKLVKRINGLTENVTKLQESDKDQDTRIMSIEKEQKKNVMRLSELEKETMSAAERLSEATQAILKANPVMKYSEAFVQAQKENPDLAKEYAQD